MAAPQRPYLADTSKEGAKRAHLVYDKRFPARDRAIEIREALKLIIPIFEGANAQQAIGKGGVSLRERPTPRRQFKSQSM